MESRHGQVYPMWPIPRTSRAVDMTLLIDSPIGLVGIAPIKLHACVARGARCHRDIGYDDAITDQPVLR